MPALQFERCKIVIKFRGRPSVSCVAIRTIQSKSSLMRLIFLMAGITILRCGLKITDCARIYVTLYTSQNDMLPGNFERIRIVIEFFSKAIYTIVTIEAG